MEIRRFEKSDAEGVANVIRCLLNMVTAEIESMLNNPLPLDRKLKKVLKDLTKHLETGVNEILNSVRENVSCVACDEGKIIGCGDLRDIKMGCRCMVLPEYEGQGIEAKLDEACWQYALEERPAPITLSINDLKSDFREFGENETRSMNLFD